MQSCGSLNILCHCLSLVLESKLTFSIPAATAEFCRFAGKLSDHTILVIWVINVFVVVVVVVVGSSVYSC